MTSYSVPGLELTFSSTLPPLDVVIVAGGRRPEEAWLRSLAEGREVWAVDGGLEACLPSAIEPSRLIGDGDSASPLSWQEMGSRGVMIDRYPKDKDMTDLQIALRTLGEEGRGGAFVTGCWGGRFDHLFSNVFSLVGSRAWGAQARCMGDEREFLVRLEGGERITLNWETPPMAISLLALSSACRDVAIEGVRWPLSKALLEAYRPYAISNEPLLKELNLSVGSGHLGLYLTWESPKKGGC